MKRVSLVLLRGSCFIAAWATMALAEVDAQEPAPQENPAPVKAPETAPAPLSAKVTVEFRVEPRWVRAHVYHGSKLLGKTPLKMKRKRNSGPVDVRVQAHGFIPVNTRAYTFKDDKIIIQLTPDAEAKTLFGYRAPLVPEEEEEPPVAGAMEAAPEPTPVMEAKTEPASP